MEQVKEHIETEKQEACPKRKRSVPELRFMDFEGMWTKMRLDSVSAKISDGTHFSPQLYEQGNYKYISSKNIRNGYMILDDVPYVSDEVHKEIYSRCDVQFNDILLTKDGASTGNVCLNELDEEFSLLSSVAMIRCDAKGAINEYVYQYICSPYGQYEIRSTIAGQAITRITLEKLRGYKFSFPSLPEQQKIASFLSAVDEKIQQLTKKKALLEQYKKGVMQQLFSGQLRFKDENGNDFPDWEEKLLGEIAEIVGGGTPETVKPDYWDGEIQWFTPTEIRSKYISNSKRTITQSGLSKSSAKLLPAGTILFTSRATIAELGFATQECTTNQGFQSLIVNQNNISEFIFQLIKVNKNEFVRKSQGSTFLEISRKEMKKMKFEVPIFEEQQTIATYLSSIDTKIESVTNQTTQTQTFKKGLLQQMFV